MKLTNRIMLGFNLLKEYFSSSANERKPDVRFTSVLLPTHTQEMEYKLPKRLNAAELAKSPLEKSIIAICDTLINEEALSLYRKKSSKNTYVSVLATQLQRDYKETTEVVTVDDAELAEVCERVAKQHVMTLTRKIDELLSKERTAIAKYRAKVLKTDYVQKVLAASKYYVIVPYLPAAFLEGAVQQLKGAIDRGIVSNDIEITTFIENLMEYSAAVDYNPDKINLLATHFRNTQGQLFNPNNFKVVEWILNNFTLSKENLDNPQFNALAEQLTDIISADMSLPAIDDALNDTINGIVETLLSDRHFEQPIKLYYQINENLKFGINNIENSDDHVSYHLFGITDKVVYFYAVKLNLARKLTSHELLSITTATQMDTIFLLTEEKVESVDEDATV